jgi:MATE family multidrug resistance protein
MTFMFHLGMSQAATIRAGTALGRRDELALRRGGITAIMVSLAFAAVTVAVFLSFPEVLVSAFIDPTEPARDGLIVVGVGLLAMAALFQLVDAAQVMALGLLRGVQDTAVPFGMAVISYWVVGMPSSYLLGFTFGLGLSASGLAVGRVAFAYGAVLGPFRADQPQARLTLTIRRPDRPLSDDQPSCAPAPSGGHAWPAKGRLSHPQAAHR